MGASRDIALWTGRTLHPDDRRRQVAALLTSLLIHATLLWAEDQAVGTASPAHHVAATKLPWQVQRHQPQPASSPRDATSATSSAAAGSSAAVDADGAPSPAAPGSACCSDEASANHGSARTRPGPSRNALDPSGANRDAARLSATDVHKAPTGLASAQTTDSTPSFAAAAATGPSRAPPSSATRPEAELAQRLVKPPADRPTAVQTAAATLQKAPKPSPATPPPAPQAPDTSAALPVRRETVVRADGSLASTPADAAFVGARDVDDASEAAQQGQRGNARVTGAAASLAQPDAPRLRAAGGAPPTPSPPSIDALQPPEAQAEAVSQADAAVVDPSRPAHSDADVVEAPLDASSGQAPVSWSHLEGAASTSTAPSTYGGVASSPSMPSVARSGAKGTPASPSAPLVPMTPRANGAWSPAVVRLLVVSPSSPAATVASTDASMPSEASAAPWGPTIAPAAPRKAPSASRTPQSPRRPRAETNLLDPNQAPTAPERPATEHPAETDTTTAFESPREPLEDPVERLARLMGWQSAAPSAASDDGVAAVRAIVLPDAFNPDLRGGVKARATPLGTYLADADDVIESAWLARPVDPARATMPRTVTLAFDIERSGRVSSLAIERPSGDTDLDLIALAAVPKRFKRVPKTIDATPLHHVLTLRYLPSTGGVTAP
ncbi:MAG: hypothetical protein RLZZ383_29 [Pseudomonadota bacterium]|jgi:TonB family protein